MKKLLFALVALLSINLSISQNYDKGYVKYRQEFINGSWGSPKESTAYFKFVYNDDGSIPIHFHDDQGIHIDAHQNLYVEHVAQTKGNWEGVTVTLIVDKDYNYKIPVNTEIKLVLWTNVKEGSAAYSLYTSEWQYLYTLYKSESVFDGKVETNTYN